MAESSVDRLNEIISRSEEKFFSGLERRFIGMDLNFRKGQIKSEVEHFAKMLSLFPHDGGKVHDKFFTRFERTLNVESKGYLSPEDKGSVVLEMVGVCKYLF